MKQHFFMTLTALVLSIFTLASCSKDELAGHEITSRAPNTSDATWTSEEACAGEDLVVTFCNDYGNSCGQTQIQQWDGIDWVQVALDTPVNGCLSYTTEADTAGTYLFRAKWTRTGNPNQCSGENTGWVEYSAVVTDCNDCALVDTTFTGTADASSCDATRGATYVLSAEQGVEDFKIQGGLTNFTGEDAIVTYEGGTNVTVTQSTPGGSSNRIITVEGDLDSCSTITIHITWNSSNGGSTITGQWSAKNNSVDLAEPVAPLACIAE